MGLLLPEYSSSQEQLLLHYRLAWLLSGCPRKPLSPRPKPAKISLKSPSVLLQSICLAETPSLRQFEASRSCGQRGCLCAKDTLVHPEQNFLIRLSLEIEPTSEQHCLTSDKIVAPCMHETRRGDFQAVEWLWGRSIPWLVAQVACLRSAFETAFPLKYLNGKTHYEITNSTIHAAVPRLCIAMP